MLTICAADEVGTQLAQHAVFASAQYSVLAVGSAFRRTGVVRLKPTPHAGASARAGDTMNEISDGAIMAALGRQMTAAVQQQLVAAGKLANLDTPGYRPRDASFGALLDGDIQKLGLATTH